jgi:hypothetical protein
VPTPPQIVVELVTWNEPGADPAGDRLQLALTDQCANVVLGAAELGSYFANRQGRGPVHERSIARAGGGESWTTLEPGFAYARARTAATAYPTASSTMSGRSRMTWWPLPYAKTARRCGEAATKSR